MRVLIVEDEPRIGADIEAALAAGGYHCDIAVDGEDAWFRGDTESYDLVVLDLGLPKMDGLAVLKRWRGAGRQMPVLLLTARGPGFPLHGYPHDWHRFTVNDMRRIFADFKIDALEADPQFPGFLLYARKPRSWRRKKSVHLGSIEVAPADEVNAPR